MIKINESELNISKTTPQSINIFMKTDTKDLDYNITKKAYDDYYSELKRFPNPNSMELLDAKYDEDKRIFYKKYYDFAKKCQNVVKQISPSGYGRNDYSLLKVKDMCKTIDYNFPYGWKNF